MTSHPAPVSERADPTARPRRRGASAAALLATVVVAVAGAATSVGAALAEPPGANAPADAAAFVAAWRDALARPDGEAIAELTAWPFRFEGRALSRREFVARAVPALFGAPARRCLQRARPVAEDGRLVVSCASHGYVFAPTPAGWRFVEFFVDAP